jgi:hypothetical protein
VVGREEQVAPGQVLAQRPGRDPDGSTRSGSAKRVETVCRPSQRTGAARPQAVSTRSPAASVSTARSPEGVATSVPGMKQTGSAARVSPGPPRRCRRRP